MAVPVDSSISASPVHGDTLNILVTGHHGYIGSVMGPFLRTAGHRVMGLDTRLYAGCDFGAKPSSGSIPDRCLDVRDVRPEHLEGFDAVVHLAALSNDPLGDLNAEATYEINHRATIRLARAARTADVRRFLFASSCSLYGSAGHQELLDEEAALEPITPYGRSKALVERDLSDLANESFSPVYLRNATVYGVSPRLRTDIVVNNLVGLAHTTGEIVLKSDGTPWRPLVHVEDVCRAFQAVLEAPREAIHDQAFNVGRTSENYRVRGIAETVAELIPETRVGVAEGAGPDPRDYRVDCTKIETRLENFRPTWTLPRGVEELRDAFREHGLAEDELRSRYVRLHRIRSLMERGLLDERIRWAADAKAASPSGDAPAMVQKSLAGGGRGR